MTRDTWLVTADPSHYLSSRTGIFDPAAAAGPWQSGDQIVSTIYWYLDIFCPISVPGRGYLETWAGGETHAAGLHTNHNQIRLKISPLRPAPHLSSSLVPSSSTAITLFNYPPSLSDQMTSFAQLRPSHTAISIIIITKVSEDILRTSDQPDTVKLLLRVHPFRFGTAISFD